MTGRRTAGARVRHDSHAALGAAIRALADVFEQPHPEPYVAAEAFMRSLLRDGWRPTAAIVDDDPAPVVPGRADTNTAYQQARRRLAELRTELDVADPDTTGTPRGLR